MPRSASKARITRYAAEPDKYYASLEIEALGKVETGVNGPIAWENSAILGPRVKSGVERAEAIREGNMNSTVNWRKLYPKVVNAGIETIDGEECYKVVMTPAEGQPMTGYYQKKSGLQVKLTTVQHPDGRHSGGDDRFRLQGLRRHSGARQGDPEGRAAGVHHDARSRGSESGDPAPRRSLYRTRSASWWKAS